MRRKHGERLRRPPAEPLPDHFELVNLGGSSTGVPTIGSSGLE